jgi:predicted RNA-binding protein with RPS1 domain
MTATAHFSAGDRVTAVVTKTLPFGALVEAADGTPGLVTGLEGIAIGASVEVRVAAFDAGQNRFSATAD